jgi:Ca-activated chloride channel family protein
VNISVVLDRSSSMSGDKIARAREAALMVLDRLGPADTFSLIAYGSTVEVLVPATTVRDKDAIADRIRKVEPSGMTALFAGVSKGLAEVQRFLDRERVNRIILLSDGQANVGPSSPNELGALGASCAKRGVAVTTIGLGLGYNEDLMAQLAMKSDGNHAFVEHPEQLATIFDSELGTVLSVVAQEVTIKLHLANGAKVVRSINRPAQIHGHTAILSLNQLYQRQEKYLLLELEIPAGQAGTPQQLGQVEVSYANIYSGKLGRAVRPIEVRYTGKPGDVERATDSTVMVAAVEAIATDNNRLALQLRDQGKVEDARRVLIQNSAYLRDNAEKLNAPKLHRYGDANETDAKNLDDDRWNRQRKVMRKTQYEFDSQQMY